MRIAEDSPPKPAAEPARRKTTPDGPPGSLAAGLRRLSLASSQFDDVDQQLRDTITATAEEVARHVHAAGLTGVRLPLDYEVRYLNRKLHLVKCQPETEDVKILASGAEDLWTRMHWQATNPTATEIREVARDLGNGWLEDICDLVERRAAGFARTSARLLEGYESRPREEGSLRQHLQLLDDE